MRTDRTINGIKVVTRYGRAPIPMTSFNWSATLDGYEPGDPVGWGETEQAAIDDLAEQVAA